MAFSLLITILFSLGAATTLERTEFAALNLNPLFNAEASQLWVAAVTLQVQMAYCESGIVNQKFTINAGNIGVIGPASDPESVCLRSPGTAGPLDLYSCAGTGDMHDREVGFRFTGNGSIPWWKNDNQVCW